MGANAADTQREIGSLRSDMTSAVAEIQRRLGGGMRSLAAGEVRVAGNRSARDLADQAAELRESPSFLPVVGTVVVAAVGYGIYEAVGRWREGRKPQNRLRRRAEEVRGDIEGRVDDVRKIWKEAREKGVLLRVEPEGAGYLRVMGAKVEALDLEKGSRKDVLKNLMWAAMLAIFMALGGVLARRAAGGVWRATVGEDPPSEKK